MDCGILFWKWITTSFISEFAVGEVIITTIDGNNHRLTLLEDRTTLNKRRALTRSAERNKVTSWDSSAFSVSISLHNISHIRELIPRWKGDFTPSDWVKQIIGVFNRK